MTYWPDLVHVLLGVDLKGQGLALAPSQGKLSICPLDGVGRDPGVIDGPGCDHSLKGPNLSGLVLKHWVMIR